MFCSERCLLFTELLVLYSTYGVRLEGWADGERNGRPRHARIAKNAATLANIVTVHVSPRGLFPQLAVTGNSWFLTTRSPLHGCRGRDRYTHARRQARTGGRRPDAGREGKVSAGARRTPVARAAPLRASRHFIAGTLPHLVSSNIYSPFQGARRLKSERDFFCSFDDRQTLYWLMNMYGLGGGGGRM